MATAESFSTVDGAIEYLDRLYLAAHGRTRLDAPSEYEAERVKSRAIGKSLRQLVEPNQLDHHCVSPGAHKRCRYLVADPTDKRLKAPRNWCEYLGETVETVDGKKPRKDECLKDYGAADGKKN